MTAQPAPGPVPGGLIALLRNARHTGTAHAPTVLDGAVADDRVVLRGLAVDPQLEVIDSIGVQLEELVRSRVPGRVLDTTDVAEHIAALLAGTPRELFGIWVHYPWSRRLVHVLPAALHRELRLDRNRHKITTAEQDVLLGLRIAVAGLSVGRAVAQTLVREGIGGEIRLADFDELALSNLNRVAGGIADIGVNKAVLAAREIAELDPYIAVRVHLDGVRPDRVDAFLDGADVLLDECDDLEIKLLLRERARAVGLPVVMVTSDRGLLDVERFDREPDRPAFHGALDGVTAADLRGLTTRQKVPYVLRILDADRLEPRTAASLVEVRQSLSTWPQLASDVVLGGAMAANAVRRIALGDLTVSGRFEADLDALVRDGSQRPQRPPRPFTAQPVSVEPPELVLPEPGSGDRPTPAELRFVVTCATLAPSGGNAQPWRFTASGGVLDAHIDASRASLLDVDGRASALALGAALAAALIGAHALGFATEPVAAPTGAAWRLALRRTPRPAAASPDLDLLARRCCRRSAPPSAPLHPAALGALATAGTPLDVTIVADPAALTGLGDALADLDRARFLTPELHRELVSEIRWSTAEALATRDGLDLAALALAPDDLAAMEVLRSAPAMAQLRRIDRGHALGDATRTAFRSAGAALVLCTAGTDRAAMVDAGRGLLRLWLAATGLGIGVHPYGGPFLTQHLPEATTALDGWSRTIVAEADRQLRAAADLPPDATMLLALRLGTATGPVARSLRRSVDDVLTITG
ncbi:Rv1355c family protein [Pseudonocardia sp. GCM10023141]|uniref:Rv1355c family protein n=1 Tax=Pseudonocardia sp. GCM10023141 TaxID=3252653 RepID=UPI00360ED51A